MKTDTEQDRVARRREKLLGEEVLACDDRICCCEAEPRWLRMQQEGTAPGEVSEWECFERSTGEEL